MAHAKAYETKDIRNVVVMGHGGSGKTSLVDALSWVSGTSHRHGKVSEGNALTWFRPEEKAHGISMYCTPAYAEWEGAKVNLLDTPGYLDFIGETVAGLHVADAALVTVSAGNGVEVGTEMMWNLLDDRKLPRIVFVSMMDKDNADFDAALAAVKERLSPKVAPVEIPIGSGEDFRGIVNIVSGKAHIYKAGTVKGEYDEADVPDDLKDRVEELRTELMETLATTDEALMERYLEGETITRDEMVAAFRTAMLAQDLYPLFVGSAEKTFGMRALLNKLVEIIPHPGELPPRLAADDETELAATDDAPFAAMVFKTSNEQHVGELSFFRVMRGKVKSGDEVINVDSGKNEKLAHLSINLGSERHEVDALHAGDIGVVARLKTTHTGHTLADEKSAIHAVPPPFPKPESRLAVRAESRNDEDKLGPALNKLADEDPCFTHHFDGEMGETIVSGLGELHLEVQFEKLAERYGVKVTTSAPQIHYRETIRREAKAQGRYKKQTGGRGQFGDCHIILRPRPRGGGYEFKNEIVGGAIPGKFIPAVDKGIQEAMHRGVIAGFPLVDFEVACVDGSYHSVDSSEMAFKVAGSMAFKKAVESAAPVLLEPVMKVTITVPNDATGDVMGDITSRRGRVLGMDTQSAFTVIEAVVPEAELYRYSSSLRSMTQGRGHHSRSLEGYEEVPAQIAEKLIADRRKAADSE